MATYLDIEKKIIYHKEQILNEFVRKGIYPTNSLIQTRVNSINKYLSIFKHYNVASGSNFDTDEYNKAIELIYVDLKILYDILYELTIKEYYNLQNYISSYINELQSTVETYAARADFENNSTTFGETLLFKNNNFTIENNNSTTIVNLDDIEIEEGSSIACLANINNVNEDNLLFHFEKDGDVIEVSPYNYSNQALVIPGTKKITNYEYQLPDNQVTKGNILMNIDSEIDIKNKYAILGGKNKIFINKPNSNNFAIEDTPTSLGAYMFTEHSYINFYVINGNSISFKFNKKPLATNFPTEEQKITNLNNIHHFFIECDADFSFEIELDKGDIYAVKEPGIINNNKLYYTGTNIINDFNIIEAAAGDKKTYKASLKIYNNNNDDLDIESIIIKKLE